MAPPSDYLAKFCWAAEAGGLVVKKYAYYNWLLSSIIPVVMAVEKAEKDEPSKKRILIQRLALLGGLRAAGLLLLLPC